MKTTGFSKNLFIPEMEKIFCLCCFRVSRTPDWVTTVKESFVRIMHNMYIRTYTVYYKNGKVQSPHPSLP